MLSKYCENELLRSSATLEDIECLKNPTRQSFSRMRHRIRREGYQEGYAKAIDDIKEITKNTSQGA